MSFHDLLGQTWLLNDLLGHQEPQLYKDVFEGV